MDVLPDDMVASVLGRLDPSSLAGCRCVCKAWRATVDAHRLLRKDLLPLSLAGILVLYPTDIGFDVAPTFFSRPASIDGNRSYLDTFRADDTDWSGLTCHCCGLLLVRDGVVNPATNQWARLPPYPHEPTPGNKSFFQCPFLAFDPTITPVSSSPQHFEVFFMHCLRHGRYSNRTEVDLENPGSEWPPSPFVMSAFSSKTWRWEERSFAREGRALRSIARVMPFLQRMNTCHVSVYWRERLYVYHIYFITRLDLEDNKYRVIELPPINKACGNIYPYFGKSEKGVYYGFVYGLCKLQVWLLDESTHQTTGHWILKHDIDLEPLLENFPWKHGDGPWSEKATLEKEEKPEWDSDNDDGITTTATVTRVSGQRIFSISVLGFHPYKEIIFLHTLSERVMAYHLNSSKAEYLGCLPLDDFGYEMREGLSFIYTPYWMEISCLSLKADVDLQALGRL
ncbi:hypothetical protein BRADI_4g41634v3 [Brachypodium distachyon]|uniref:F-box domain-containing protein n=1 Tax=Brachypodium distachyon TaxID=15368 RepID=A0A0Q3PRE6_BRADI|nr:hypothetical protein BRADI_4g41634v3 [Brachypodium distachyon]